MNTKDTTQISELLSMSHRPYYNNKHVECASKAGRPGGAVRFKDGARADFNKQVTDASLSGHVNSFKSYMESFR